MTEKDFNKQNQPSEQTQGQPDYSLTGQAQNGYSNRRSSHMNNSPEMRQQNNGTIPVEESEKEAPLVPDERKLNQQEAINPHNIAALDPDSFSNSKVSGIAASIRRAYDSFATGYEQNLMGALDKISENINMLPQDPSVPPEEVERLMSGFKVFQEEYIRQLHTKAQIEDQEMRGDQNLYLTAEDVRELYKDPIEWLNGQFDTIYTNTSEGQELNSPALSLIQQKMAYIDSIIRNRHPDKPHLVEQVHELFNIRLGLMNMRNTMEYRASPDQIAQAAMGIRAHGLMTAMGFEKGRVGSMFHRMQEYLEDVRLRTGGLEGHVYPSMVAEMQVNLIKEQVALAEKGLGVWGNWATDEAFKDFNGDWGQAQKKVETTILRTMRTAYDVFVVTQRQALIVSRGKHLSGVDAFLSDPAGIFSNVFNIEDLSIDKWDLLTVEQKMFLKVIKLDLADSDLQERGLNPKTMSEDERLRLGTKLFIDLYAVPDFFSSGWRMKYMNEQRDKLFAYKFAKQKIEQEGKAWDKISPAEQTKALLSVWEQAETESKKFGLFLQLKGADEKGRAAVWKEIKKYRVEEMWHLYRERARDDLDELARAFAERGVTAMDEHGSPVGVDLKNPATAYDIFKQKYGPVMRSIREEFFRRDIPMQLDFGNLGAVRDEVMQKVDKALGAGEGQKLTELYQIMQSLMTDKKIEILTGRENASLEIKERSKAFDGIYTRVLFVDDLMLGDLEKPPADSNLTPLAKIWSSEPGADALVRNMRDIGNAYKAGEHLIGFLSVEDEKGKLKAAEEFGDSVGAYNGKSAKAKAIRFTEGSYLILSKSKFLLDALGVAKLPFRIPSTEYEKIFGPLAVPKSRDELRVQLDHLRGVLIGAASELSVEEKAELESPNVSEARKAELHAKIEHRIHEAEKWYLNMEKELGVTVADTVKLRAFSLLFFLMLAVISETYKMVDPASMVKGK